MRVSEFVIDKRRLSALTRPEKEYGLPLQGIFQYEIPFYKHAFNPSGAHYIMGGDPKSTKFADIVGRLRSVSPTMSAKQSFSSITKTFAVTTT